MNQSQVLTGMLDGSSNEMVVWDNGKVVTRISPFYESYGVLINDNGIAAGLGSYGISQDDRLIIATQHGEFDVVATINGSAGWSSLTAINENGSVAGNIQVVLVQVIGKRLFGQNQMDFNLLNQLQRQHTQLQLMNK